MTAELIYLAVPYTAPNKEVEASRFRMVSNVAARMMHNGQFVFSPITQGHVLAQHGDLPTDWAYWAEYSRSMLSKCDRLSVLCLDGWKESVGVQAEIGIAKELDIPVEYVFCADFG